MAALLALLIQDPLDVLLKRLSDDAFEVREQAQKELHEYLEGDGAVERLQKSLAGLEIDARQRAREVLDAHERRRLGWIAFIRREETQELWIVRPDGTEARALTREFDVDFNHLPMWSPDAKRLAFIRKTQVHVIDVDGRNLKQLTAGEARNADPLWTRDGTAIVYSSYLFDAKSNSGTSIWKSVSFQGTNAQELPHDAWPWRSAGRDFSPDGSLRVDAWAGQIRVSKPDGTDRREITPKKGNGVPVWSPDGRWIAYSSTRDDKPRIYVIDSEGKEESLVTPGDGYSYGATWAPDSRQIAYVSTQPDFEGICVVGRDGKNRKLITDRKSYAPSWSPAVPLKPSK